MVLAMQWGGAVPALLVPNPGFCVQQKSQELQKQHALVQETLQMAQDALAQVSDFLQMMERAKEVSGRGALEGQRERCGSPQQ